MKPTPNHILERALARERAARKQAESILEEKSTELYKTSQKLQETNKQLEDLVKEKTSQLQGVFENIIDAYMVMDLKGNVLKMNDAANSLFGYNLKNETLNVTKLIYPEDFEYAMSSFQELIETGFFRNYIARISTKEKKIRWVQINSSLIYSENNVPIAAQGIVRDITESRKDRELIEEQRKELEIIVDNSSLGIALTKQDSFVKANRAFTDMLGYHHEELLQLKIGDVSFPDDLPATRTYLQQMDSGAIDNFTMDKRYIAKNGTIIWAKTTVNAVRDDLGDIKYQVAIIEDITL